MSKNKKNTFSIELLLILTVFAMFVWIDIGWSNISILQMKSIDEHAFHGSLIRMYKGVVENDIRGIFSYGFYSYGFIFFLVNLIVSFKFLFHDGIGAAIILPRIVTSVCFLIAQYGVIRLTVKMGFTLFERVSVLLMILLMPGVWFCATWFHPDYMMTALLVWSFVYLIDWVGVGNRKNFYLSISLFAFAVSVKIQAATFLPVFFWVIILQGENKMKGYIKSCSNASAIVLFVAVVYVFTNPYLLNSEGRSVWLKSFLDNIRSNANDHSSGRVLTIDFKIEKSISEHYFGVLALLLLVVTLINNLVGSIKCLVLKRSLKSDVIVWSALSVYLVVNNFYNIVVINKAWVHYYLPLSIFAIPVLVHGVKDLIKFTKIGPSAVKQQTNLRIILLSIGVLYQFNNYGSQIWSQIHDRSNGIAISANSLNLYHPEKVNEWTEVLKSKRILDILSPFWRSEYVIMISPYIPFPYKTLNVGIDSVRIIYGPLDAGKIDKVIKQKGRLDFILIRKDDLYYNRELYNERCDAYGYEKGFELLERWKRGDGEYRLVMENDCYQLFGKTKVK
jgi:hypothetical protein